MIETSCQPNLQFANVFARCAVGTWFADGSPNYALEVSSACIVSDFCCKSNLEMVDFPGISANIILSLELELVNSLFMTRLPSAAFGVRVEFDLGWGIFWTGSLPTTVEFGASGPAPY